MPGWSARRGEVHVAGRGGQTDAQQATQKSTTTVGAEISLAEQGKEGGRRKAAATRKRK